MIEIPKLTLYNNDMLHGERVLDLESEDKIIHGEMEGRSSFLGELIKETKGSRA